MAPPLGSAQLPGQVALSLEADALLGARDVASARKAWRARREEALRARWELQVHRDALGLFRQSDVEEQFPVPRRPPR